ncbi:MAG TPA: hypothetical protein VED63_09795 [Acidimicrobiales bacterium]|nr:hypothetical protein [Acidimicrobiales bacterium]
MAETTAIGPPLSRNHHMARVVSLKGLGGEVKKVEGFNAKLAVILTNVVGSMACAYVFCLIALASLPAVITQTGWIPKTTFPSWLINVSLIALVAWVAQTFLQLVLLSVIMVGQGVQGAASDARAINTYNDTVAILDRLDVRTEGGLKDIMDRLDELKAAAKG